MQRNIAAFEARRNLGKILDDVTARGESFIVERHGAPIAAIVPIALYEQWRRDRDAFFARLREISERSDLTPEEAELLAREAVAAVRSGR